MSKQLDVNRLIAEVKQRPALWDVRLAEYKDRAASALLWREIAENVGCDVEQCKRKWKNIRDAYRAEVRRTERRVQRLKLEGHDDPKVSDSKWAFFKPMSFMSESKRKRYSTPPTLSNEHSSDSHEAYTTAEAEAEASGGADDQLDIDDYCQIKMEHHTTDEEGDLKSDFQHSIAAIKCAGSSSSSSGSAAIAAAAAAAAAASAATTTTTRAMPGGDEDDDANDKLFEQFQSMATPQAARRLSGTLTLASNIGAQNSPPTAAAAAAVTASTTTAIATIVNSNGNRSAAAAAAAAAAAGTTKNANCKCSPREDQVHFLEDLEREEQQLMQSTRRDITRASSMSFLGDSDYNFLVSFLPQMKRLSELQNLQFRAKMSELMLHIMAQPTSAAATLPAFGCIGTATPVLQQRHHHAYTVHHAHQAPQAHPQPPPPHHHHHHTTATTIAEQPLLPPPIQQQQQQAHVTEATTTTWIPSLPSSKPTELEHEQQQNSGE